ncbi:MAG: DUF4124 domain-containing protein [Acinetobacter sp.]
MKMPFAKLGSAAAALALAMSAQSSFAQNFYKWVDAKGSTHYTAAPPPKSAKKKGQVETYGWKNAAAPAPAAGGQAQPEAKAAAQEAQQAAAEKEQVHQEAQAALRQGQALSSEAK